MIIGETSFEDDLVPFMPNFHLNKIVFFFTLALSVDLVLSSDNT